MKTRPLFTATITHNGQTWTATELPDGSTRRPSCRVEGPGYDRIHAFSTSMGFWALGEDENAVDWCKAAGNEENGIAVRDALELEIRAEIGRLMHGKR